ncbi:TPA: hypothetical protein ACYR80_003127 [Morganella morganii]
MRIASRMAGISLQDGEIRIALARRVRRRWCFEDFITLTLPETESAENGVPGLSVVAAALAPWRRRIRGRPDCRAALPVSLCLQQQIRLPESRVAQSAVVPLIDTWLARTFPGRHQDLIYDYRWFSGDIILTALHRTVRDQWLSLAAELRADLTVLSIIPCALRCFACARGGAAQDWLVFRQGNSLCWTAGETQPVLSGRADLTLPSLLTELKTQGFDESQAALCCLHDTALLPQAWQRECRRYRNAEADDVPPGYAAAAGMVLCGEERL